MPKVKRSRKPPPEGWELIEPTLEELDQKMREAETDSHEGKRKCEALWPIFKIHHQRSRYIFDLFYRRKAISRGKSHFILIFSTYVVTCCRKTRAKSLVFSYIHKFSSTLKL